MGLRTAAERLGISPAYLSRIERGKERPPKPEVIKRIIAVLAGALAKAGPHRTLIQEDRDGVYAEAEELVNNARARSQTSSCDKLLIHDIEVFAPSNPPSVARVIAGAACRTESLPEEDEEELPCAAVSITESSPVAQRIGSNTSLSDKALTGRTGHNEDVDPEFWLAV